MNIFQLILNDPNHRSQIGLGGLQQSWSIFLGHIRSLQTIPQQEFIQVIQNGSSLWNNVCSSNPNAVRMFRQHYIYHLKDLVKRNLSGKIQLIGQQQTKQKKLFQCINEAHRLYIAHERYIQIVDQNRIIINSLIESIQKLLTKIGVQQQFYTVFEQTFRKHCLSIFKQDIIDFDENIKQYITSICEGKTQFSMDFNDLKLTFKKLHEMNLLPQYYEKIYFMLVRDCQLFLINCSEIQSSSKFFSNTLNYQRVFQKSFIKKMKSQQTQSFLTKSNDEIEESIYFLCSKFCSKNILEIVLDYPDSHGVIMVLKKCLDKSNLLNELSEHLYQGVKRRLLIPGVITQNILNQYLNMLKVLQIIDPQGMVFQKITVPIKNYLLKRNDTLRCIISHMTQNGEISSGLTRDMVRIPSKDYIDEESSDQNEKAAEQWQILNVKQSKMRIRVKYQQIDLATVLVNLYGSQQAFITEYQNMLAQKLMSAKMYNIQEEIKNIQLLKMRFGENALQNCNVIVKDVRDSKKNDTVIHKQKSKVQKTNPLFLMQQMNCLAVSKGYWPINYDTTSTFQLPQEIKLIFAQYAEQFAKIKAMRKIHYHNSLGNVNLTLTFKNGEFEFKCLPVHAVLIGYFDQDKMKANNFMGNMGTGVITSEELSNAMHIPPNVVKQKMSFWVQKGVVRQIRQHKVAGGLSLKRLNSIIQQVQNVGYKAMYQYISVPRDQMDDDVDEFISKENTSMESHLKHIIQGLILSILSINGPKSPQKIHLLLKTVYKTDLDYAYGQPQTIEILKKMVQKKKITFNGQAYSRISR